MAPPRSQGAPDPLGHINARFGHLEHETRRLQKRLCRLEAIEALRERGRTPALPVAFRSQFGEDVLLWELFGDQPDGFFIEVGAFDGVSLSVSYAYESIGWKGLLVEALPDRYAQCVKNRPNSRVVQAALSKRGSAGTATFEAVAGDDHAEMLSYLTPTQQHLDTLKAMNASRTRVTVPLSTMNDVLKDHTGPIDFAVIDVEGGELDLLDGFDLYRHKPRVMLIEDNHAGKSDALRAYMASFPYTEVGWIGVNRIFIRADETALLARVQPS